MDVTELSRAANIAAAVVADVALTENQRGAWLRILSLIFKSWWSFQLAAINNKSSVPTAAQKIGFKLSSKFYLMILPNKRRAAIKLRNGKWSAPRISQ
jgi:hypothetical protein